MLRVDSNLRILWLRGGTPFRIYSLGCIMTQNYPISLNLMGRGVKGAAYLEFGGGSSSEKGRVCTPHLHQAVPKIPSWLNVRKKVAIASLCTLSSMAFRAGVEVLMRHHQLVMAGGLAPHSAPSVPLQRPPVPAQASPTVEQLSASSERGREALPWENAQRQGESAQRQGETAQRQEASAFRQEASAHRQEERAQRLVVENAQRQVESAQRQVERAQRQEESAQRQQRGVELVNGCEIVSDNEEDEEEGMDSMTVLFETMMADFDEVNSNTEERKREREGEEQTENVPLYLRYTEFAKKSFFA